MANIFDTLKGVAPTIAGALAGTFGGPAVGAAVKTLGNKLLGNPDASVAEVHAAVATATPEQLLAIKQEEDNFKLDLIRLGYRPMELEVADRSSARQMQIAALMQEDKFAKNFVYIFALLWSTFAVIYLSAVTFGHFDNANQHTVDTVTGFLLGTIVSTLLSFFYGTSYSERGRRKRDDLESTT